MSTKRQLELALCGAAEHGDVEKVTRLIQDGVDVNCADYHGLRPLHWAAIGGHVGVAELLLEAGAELDSRDMNGRTPLFWAALRHVGVAELLLEAGAPVNSRDVFGDTPLHNAASKGHVGVAELFLKAGAQVDSRNKDGKTAEDIAAGKGIIALSYRSAADKDRILEGRKRILELFKQQTAAGAPRPTRLSKLPIEVRVTRQMGYAGAAPSSATNSVSEHFYFIKERVATDWMDLAFHLGFKGADIRNIAGRNPDDKSSCMDLLWEWEKRKGDAATVEVLMEALSKAELQNVVDGLKKLVVK